ncbi:hypothetical protein PVAND_001063 [Polypedilum vanderplanki]|uniref:Gustatory receptor n=1 Tax=Polypedilum vanderplanki TaxID=319348 RepID=A0A9J6BLU0_POLVA|nr:hypothetical protein PVAND_001063 [Polypedilum vanderplanki]
MSSILGGAWVFTTSLGILATIISMIYQYCKIEKIWTILKEIFEFDEKAKSLKLSVDYNSHRKKSIFVIFSTFSIVIFDLVIVLCYLYDGKIQADSFISRLYFFNFLYSNAFIFQYSSAAIAVKDRFKILHENILNQQFLGNSQIEIIVELYEKNFEILKFINFHLSSQLIPTLAYLLGSIIFTLYSIAKLFPFKSKMAYYSLPLYILYLMVHIVLIIFAIHSSVSTVEEAEKIHKIEYEITKDEKFLNFHAERKFLKFIKMIEKIDFRLGTIFFALDWKLFLQVIPLYFFLKIFGLFASSFIGAFSNGILRSKIIDKIYFFIILFYWILVGIYNTFEPLPSEELFSNSLVLVRVWYMTTNCGTFAIIVSMIYQYLKFDEILKIFKTIYDFDEKAKLLKIHINYSTHIRQSSIFILFSVIFMIFINILIYIYYVLGKISKFDPFVLTLFMILYFFCNAFVFQFMCAAVAVRDRFRNLNDKILSLHFLNNFEVKLMIELYEKLFNSFELINSNLSFQLIPIIGYLLISIIFTIYTIVLRFTHFSFVSFGLLIPHSIWIIAHTLIIVKLIHASVTAVDAAKRIFNVEYEISKYEKIFDKYSKQQFYKFVKLIKSNNVRLGTALFDIDWKLFMQCVSAALTFIIVTCQFETTIPNQKNENITSFFT